MRGPPRWRHPTEGSPKARAPRGPWRRGLDAWSPRAVGDTSHRTATRHTGDDAHGPATALVLIGALGPEQSQGDRLARGCCTGAPTGGVTSTRPRPPPPRAAVTMT